VLHDQEQAIPFLGSSPALVVHPMPKTGEHNQSVCHGLASGTCFALSPTLCPAVLGAGRSSESLVLAKWDWWEYCVLPPRSL
jgi:hypothetical protein